MPLGNMPLNVLTTDSVLVLISWAFSFARPLRLVFGLGTCFAPLRCVFLLFEGIVKEKKSLA